MRAKKGPDESPRNKGTVDIVDEDRDMGTGVGTEARTERVVEGRESPRTYEVIVKVEWKTRDRAKE